MFFPISEIHLLLFYRLIVYYIWANISFKASVSSLISFVSVWSVHWHKWDGKVPYYNIANFSLCLILFAVCIYICSSSSDSEEYTGNAGDQDSVPRLERSSGERNGYPLNILAWKVPQKEVPGGLLYMGSQRVGHYWATNTSLPSHVGRIYIFTIVLSSYIYVLSLCNDLPGKGLFSFQSKERQCERMLKLLHNFTHLTC